MTRDVGATASLLAAAMLMSAAAAPCAAQRTPQTGAGARVAGIVYDSVSHTVLAGALVQLVSIEGDDPQRGAEAAPRHSSLTDGEGRFAFPAVSRGRYVIGFFHPKLDSLGVDAPLAPVVVDHGAPHVIELAVPSVASVITAACGSEAMRDSGGVVLGSVRRATNGGPLANASVRARWSEIVIGTRRGAGVHVRESVARTGHDGRYALCRVPAGGFVLVNAATGADSGATLEVSVPADGLLLRDVYVSTATEETVAGWSTLRGTVRNPYGDPLPGARVRLWGETRETRSNERGEFLLAGVPTGTRMVELRALGFAPRRELVDLRARAELVVDLPLEEFPTEIDTIRVFGAQAERRDHRLGFTRRRAQGQGVFLDADEVERRRPLAFSDLLRGISGVEIVTIEGSRAVAMRSLDGSGQCEPELVVDGQRVPRYDVNIDDLVPASIVQAIEVYPRRIQAPAEYQSLTCGSVVVWTGARGWLATRGRRPRPGQ